jgi:uncharacterized membrane protein
VSTDGKQDEEAKAPKKRRWLKPLLIVSFGFNLLFVGLVVGRIWSHGYGSHDSGRHRIFTGAIEELMKTLPDDKRQLAGELLMRHRDTVRTLKKQKFEERNAAEKAVLKEPYDEAEVAKVLARFREIRNSQHQSMHTMMMGVMKGLTLKERKALLSNIISGFRHRGRHGRHRDGRPRNEPGGQQSQ